MIEAFQTQNEITPVQSNTTLRTGESSTMPIPQKLARQSGFALAPVLNKSGPLEFSESSFLKNGIPTRDDEVTRATLEVKAALDKAAAKAAAEVPVWAPPSQRVSKERKLYTATRKRWRNVGRRFSSPFASILRMNRNSEKKGGGRGILRYW